MFDLENEIQKWLRSFRKHRAFDHGYVREMELHLRDHIDDLVANGYGEQEAFKKAVAEFGDISSMAKEEFRNLETKKKITTIVYTAMLKNFYFTAVRHFFRHSNYFLINVSGLAIGITSFIFISLYMVNEVSYDRFHANYENIHRVNSKAMTAGGATDFATTNSPLAKTLLSNYPEVIAATRVLNEVSLHIGLGNEHYTEDGVLFADSTFLKVFDFRLLAGNAETALVNPRSMVLTETYAKKYFGDIDPLGQLIRVEDDTMLYVVTGVIADVPANSHIQFDMVGSMSTHDHWNDDRWIGEEVHTYIVLSDNASADALEEKIQEIIYKHVGPEIEYYTGQTMAEWEKSGNRASYSLIPIKDIHLRSTSTRELEPTGSISYIYIYGMIGFVILFIAIFNFVNMATAQSVSRAREVGVRKVIGSTKAKLMCQFIFESVLMSVLATFIACVTVKILTPYFTGLVGKEMAFEITSGYTGMLMLFLVAVFVGILAGFYPAFILAAYQPVDVLKGTFNAGARSGWLRNFLVVIQFTASIVIIIATLVVYHQIDLMLNRNLGFDREQILVIRRPDVLKNNLKAFRNDLLTNPDISEVANSSTIPGKAHAKRSYRSMDNSETHLFMFNHVSFNYHKIMGLELLSGRFFSKEHGLDRNAVVINEAAARALGFEDPVGRELSSPWHPDEPVKIIGVVKDYNVESLHKKIEPAALELIPHNMDGYITVKISNNQNVREAVRYVQDTWLKYANGKPFESFFFDEDYENLYKTEFSTGRAFMVFAILSIFLASLGLIGLLAFTVSARRKELGIRKILGANTGKLIKLLSGEIVKLIMIATLVAWPLAYFASEYWLQNFTDRLSFSPWLYVSSTGILTLVCAIAVGFQVVKAATGNPVNCLRQE